MGVIPSLPCGINEDWHLGRRRRYLTSLAPGTVDKLVWCWWALWPVLVLLGMDGWIVVPPMALLWPQLLLLITETSGSSRQWNCTEAWRDRKGEQQDPSSAFCFYLSRELGDHYCVEMLGVVPIAHFCLFFMEGITLQLCWSGWVHLEEFLLVKFVLQNCGPCVDRGITACLNLYLVVQIM